jgi:hypothetical protein
MSNRRNNEKDIEKKRKKGVKNKDYTIIDKMWN